jgi:hypothetical protein
MKKINIFFLVVIIASIGHGQEIQEKIVRGKVFDVRTNRPLNGAMVELMKSEHKAYTDSAGYFNINVIRKAGSLVCSSEGYRTLIYSYKGPRWKGPHEIGLTDTLAFVRNRIAADSVWSGIWEQHKNALCFLPFELIIGSLAVQYERMLTLKHSVGLHTSCYLFGWGYSMNTGGETSNFTGIKFAPFYRFYAKSKTDSRFFIEGKLITGYFNMHPVLYRYDVSYWFDIDYLTVERDLNFWTFGGGIALGWAIRMPKINNGIFNLSLGFQALPLRAPPGTSVKEGYDVTYNYNLDELWWYLGGPGSVFQIKLAYGGFF